MKKLLLTASFVSFYILSLNAQYTKLLDFSGTTNGGNPMCSFISDGTFLYGTTEGGGTNLRGTIFKIKTDGTGYQKLHDFTGSANSFPRNGLIYDGTFLYGTAYGELAMDYYGVIFKIKPDGTGYVNLLDFDNYTNGKSPSCSLIYDGTFLYGMTSMGGPYSKGIIFKIKPDGTGYAKLFDFTDTTGIFPRGSLTSDGTFLYGMTNQGGVNSYGTVFKIKPDGTEFTKLLNFAGITNGRYPSGKLLIDGSFLYGMTNQGGVNDYGTVFKIKPDGTEYTKLLDFAGITNGVNPSGKLITDGSFLYGMTNQGGVNNKGVIFKYQYCVSVTNNQSFTICKGDSITVENNSYTTTGIYYDTLTSINDCDSIIITDLTVITVDTVVNQTENTLTANAIGVDYRWLDCDNSYAFITGETGQSFIATINGNYAVEITDNGCIDTSACYNIVSVGIYRKISDLDILIYPNPTSRVITIKGDNIQAIELMNIKGQIIRKIAVYEEQFAIDLSKQAKGSYLIKIITNKGIAIEKIVFE